jgi:hypothetical protein
VSAGGNSDRDTEAPERPFAVVAVKLDGRRTLFGRYLRESEAKETVAALRRVGLTAEVMDGNGLPQRPGEAVDLAAATAISSDG